MSNDPSGGASATTATTGTTELGVVDPIRLPGFVRPGVSRGGAAWQRLPMLGKAFVVLALADIATRALGVFGGALFLDPAVPISFVTAFVPRTLLILLPALLLLRRRDAASATPLVLRGAVILALVELLRDPLSSFAFGLPDGSGVVPGMGVGIGRTILSSVGWLAIAIGLNAVTTGRPGAAIAGLANLVFGALLAAALISLGLTLALAPPDLGEPTWNTVSMVSNALFVVEAGVLAYLARVVVRGSEDARRPAFARALASTATVLGAAITAVVAVLSGIILVQVVFAIPASFSLAEGAPGWLAGWPVTLALLVALALGLADNSVRLPASGGSLAPGGADPTPDPVRWPDPGGDVPTFRPVSPDPASPAADASPRAAPARKSRRRKS
jgi:hypothetical protein